MLVLSGLLPNSVKGADLNRLLLRLYGLYSEGA